jgi:hypothetical protein
MSSFHDPGIDSELAELLACLIDESITDEQFTRLDQRLKHDPQARRLYLDYLEMHDDLRTLSVQMVVDEGWAGVAMGMPGVTGESGDVAAPNASSGPKIAKVRKPRRATNKMLLVGLAMLVLVALSAFLWHSLSRQARVPQPRLPESYATLTRATDCVWEGPAHPQPGDDLTAGPLKLLRGMAEIKLISGVDLLIEGPADVEFVDAGNSVLHTGRMVARVPPAATGYTVDTPKAKVVDLGTEFGVAVEPDRETVVQVFAGAVVAELKGADDSGERSRRLVAGETVRIDASGAVELQKVAFSHERFLRTFATPSFHEGEELIPFKPSEVSSLEVVAAPGRVTIDGDLSDWDLSGTFEARCPGPFAESYYVRGSMMYDRQYLYIAAQVGDPMPMRNVIAPESDPWSAWLGGSLQFRLSTDRTFGWPLQAAKPCYRRGRDKPVAQDTSDRIVHLTLWYFQPREQPCLELRYGMNLDRGVVNPPGWKGAFRKAADGKSYTVECAIPWALLGAGSDPPRAGDELGLCWTINWSDASGKRWKGQLVEIKNPAYAARGKKLTFQFGETWGKAVYK